MLGVTRWRLLFGSGRKDDLSRRAGRCPIGATQSGHSQQVSCTRKQFVQSVGARLRLPLYYEEVRPKRCRQGKEGATPLGNYVNHEPTKWYVWEATGPPEEGELWVPEVACGKKLRSVYIEDNGLRYFRFPSKYSRRRKHFQKLCVAPDLLWRTWTARIRAKSYSGCKAAAVGVWPREPPPGACAIPRARGGPSSHSFPDEKALQIR